MKTAVCQNEIPKDFLPLTQESRLKSDCFPLFKKQRLRQSVSPLSPFLLFEFKGLTKFPQNIKSCSLHSVPELQLKVPVTMVSFVNTRSSEKKKTNGGKKKAYLQLW